VFLRLPLLRTSGKLEVKWKRTAPFEDVKGSGLSVPDPFYAATQSSRCKPKRPPQRSGKVRLGYPRRRMRYAPMTPVPTSSTAAGKSNNPNDGPPVLGISIILPFFSIILGCCSMRTAVDPRERPL